jgi:hypothetical protein
MDFFEQWFGISPDGGDGSLEMLWIAAIVVAVAAFAFRSPIARWLRTARSRFGRESDQH